jgi:hypothetical protein
VSPRFYSRSIAANIFLEELGIKLLPIRHVLFPHITTGVGKYWRDNHVLGYKAVNILGASGAPE